MAGWGQLRSNLTDKEKKAIIYMRSTGASIMDIVVASGRSKTTVKRILKVHREELQTIQDKS